MSSRFLWGDSWWGRKPNQLSLSTINYQLSNCFSRILINANNDFQWFSHALLNFTLKQSCTYRIFLGKFAAVYPRTRFLNIFKFFKLRNRKCASFSLLWNLITPLHLKFLPKLRKNYKLKHRLSRVTGGHCTLMADNIRVAQPITLQHLHQYTSRILLIVFITKLPFENFF